VLVAFAVQDGLALIFFDKFVTISDYFLSSEHHGVKLFDHWNAHVLRG